MKSAFISLVLLNLFYCGLSEKPKDAVSGTLPALTNDAPFSTYTMTNFSEYHYDEGTNLFTLTNAPAVQIGGGVPFVHLSDAEWNQFTNAYRTNIVIYPSVEFKSKMISFSKEAQGGGK